MEEHGGPYNKLKIVLVAFENEEREVILYQKFMDS